MVFLRVSGLNIYPCSSEYLLAQAKCMLRVTGARKSAQFLSAEEGSQPEI